MQTWKLKKPHFLALERLYEGEIEAALGHDELSRLVQSKARVYRDMETLGLCQLEKITLPGRFPVTIEGWTLTHLGRWAYCENCVESEAREAQDD